MNGNESIQQELLSHLPEGLQNNAELIETLRSPQLQQALGALTGALQTDNFNAVFANFGLDPAAGAESLARGNGVQVYCLGMLLLHLIYSITSWTHRQ